MTKATKINPVAQFIARAIKQLRETADELTLTEGKRSEKAVAYRRQARALRVVYIANRLAEGLSQHDISLELNITPGRVSQIWNEHLRSQEKQA